MTDSIATHEFAEKNLTICIPFESRVTENQRNEYPKMQRKK